MANIAFMPRVAEEQIGRSQKFYKHSRLLACYSDRELGGDAACDCSWRRRGTPAQRYLLSRRASPDSRIQEARLAAAGLALWGPPERSLMGSRPCPNAYQATLTVQRTTSSDKQAQLTENQLERLSIASRFAEIDGSIQRTAAR